MSTEYLYPDVADTGFDGTHVFKVPVSTRYPNPTWSIKGVNHTWNLTDAERQAIVPYLWTLPPRAF